MGVLEFVDKAPSRIGTAPLRSVFTTTLFNMIDLNIANTIDEIVNWDAEFVKPRYFSLSLVQQLRSDE
jgi:hypothetical protein